MLEIALRRHRHRGTTDRMRRLSRGGGTTKSPRIRTGTLTTDSGTLVAVFERFTDRARRVFVLAQEEARTMQCPYIGPEHLLLGMLAENQGLAAEALSTAGVDYEQARQRVEALYRRRSTQSSGSAPFSDGAKRILERALRVSLARGDGEIDTEHLLLGLLDQKDDQTTAIFVSLDVTKEEIHQQLENRLEDRTRPVNPVLRSPLPRALDLMVGSDQPRRLDMLEGVLWGMDHIGEVIEILRGSVDRNAARDVLMAPPFALSANQATGVLDMRVDSVTVEHRQQVVEEIETLRREISRD